MTVDSISQISQVISLRVCQVAGKLFTLIIGTIFIVAGSSILGETVVPTFNDWRNMQQWQPVSGNLVQVKQSNNDTLAIYTYRVNQKKYINDRVYVATFKDNIGRYHQNMFHKLVRLQGQGEPVTVWYNARNPQQSVIDKNMRWGLISLATGFCSVFILIGFTAIYYGVFGKVKTAKANSLSQLRKQWQGKKHILGCKKNLWNM